jgi:AcrR family transcriptional regulator
VNIHFEATMRNGRETRARIERAALELFLTKGVRETTIRDIAERAGVAEGALYRHHPSKDDLLWSLFSRNYVALGMVLEEVAGRHSGIDDRLTALVTTLCRLHDEDPVLFGFLLLVQHGQLGRIDAATAGPIAVLQAVVEDGIGTGELPARDPTVLAAMILGIVLETATFKLYGRIGAPMNDLAPTLAAACRAAARSG